MLGDLKISIKISFIFTKDIDEEHKKCNEVKELIDHLCQPSVKIEGVETQVGKTYDEISMLEDNNERIKKRFSLLREHLLMKLSTIKHQLEDCLSVETSFDKFIHSYLNAVEIASYAICVLLSIL